MPAGALELRLAWCKTYTLMDETPIISKHDKVMATAASPDWSPSDVDDTKTGDSNAAFADSASIHQKLSDKKSVDELDSSGLHSNPAYGLRHETSDPTLKANGPREASTVAEENLSHTSQGAVMGRAGGTPEAGLGQGSGGSAKEQMVNTALMEDSVLSLEADSNTFVTFTLGTVTFDQSNAEFMDRLDSVKGMFLSYNLTHQTPALLESENAEVGPDGSVRFSFTSTFDFSSSSPPGREELLWLLRPGALLEVHLVTDPGNDEGDCLEIAQACIDLRALVIGGRDWTGDVDVVDLIEGKRVAVLKIAVMGVSSLMDLVEE
ncbi:hypothetical protein M427DRAFT_351732 [Gonapodya prolifera JEL478]|uniref:RPGRIP1 C-terminal domain-containing protein n=1 Tax=Gonapodya prolifera (strain JEL478) TaxID=1344416 RepID=A0A139ABW1_GONPJ|nr:hypothetical protein M427DRAFT_351732 [Gonapodya prolifera JEL478]|eukprot:KXS14218.1 hypothetical protein M427DRAFT_351732 [Gonapodya prolifera JEL478]